MRNSRGKPLGGPKLLSPEELKKLNREDTRRNLIKTFGPLKVVGKEASKVAVGLAKIPVDIVKYLGEESKKYEGVQPRSGGRVDIGLGAPSKDVKKVRRAETSHKLSKGQKTRADRLRRERRGYLKTRYR